MSQALAWDAEVGAGTMSGAQRLEYTLAALFVLPPRNPKRKLREGELPLSLDRPWAVQWGAWSIASKPTPSSTLATT